MEDYVEKDPNSLLSGKEDFDTSSLMNKSTNTNASKSLSPCENRKSVRELNLENMKLTEVLIQQNLDQTSNIEKISNDKSRLLVMLHQQKIKNKKLNEENTILANHLAQLMENKSNNSNETPRETKETKQTQNSETKKEPMPKKLFGPELVDIEPSHRSQLPSNLVSPINGASQWASTHSDPRCILQMFQPAPQFQFNQNPSYSMNEVMLLQNHIALVEKENELLKREISLQKQQEPFWGYKLKEMEMELKMANDAKQKLANENNEIKATAQQKYEELNQKFVNLTHLNQEMAQKLKNYQKVIEKLTNELYACALNQQSNNPPQTQRVEPRIQLGTSSARSSLNLQDMNLNHMTERNPRYSVENDDVIQLRQENFKLRADFKALNELSENLARENNQMKNILSSKKPLAQQNENILTPMDSTPTLEDERKFSFAGEPQKIQPPKNENPRPQHIRAPQMERKASQSRLKEIIASVDATKFARINSEKRLSTSGKKQHGYMLNILMCI